MSEDWHVSEIMLELSDTAAFSDAPDMSYPDLGEEQPWNPVLPNKNRKSCTTWSR